MTRIFPNVRISQGSRERSALEQSRKEISNILDLCFEAEHFGEVGERTGSLLEVLDKVPGTDVFGEQYAVVRNLYESGEVQTSTFLKAIYALGEKLGADLPEIPSEGPRAYRVSGGIVSEISLNDPMLKRQKSPEYS